MAIYPAAIWKPLLPENATEPAITATQVILHSAVSAADSLHGYFGRESVVVESHFYVRWDGTVEQYIDTDRQADANYRANVRAISIETEDDGDPDRRPWSAEQIQALVALVTWICDTEGIPKQWVTTHDAPGIGYHSQFREWSPVVKTCPGLARRPQVAQIVDAVVGGQAPSAPATPAPVPSHTAARMLRKGDRGQDVAEVQRRLQHLGYDIGPAGVDGIFGDDTAAAVRHLQATAGIGVDGIVGPQTRGALDRGVRNVVQHAPHVPAYPGVTRQGMRGAVTRAYQQRLKDRGWRITVDGDHGPATTAVLKAFQAEKGLAVDGVGGRNTWTALWTRPIT